ncbi:MAG: chemotaxis protein CheW [Desulfuromonas sp.]|nr:MAG: chemotaxis protein CheW [Desulfuromonas sp.]
MAETASATNQFVTFNLGNELFGVPVEKTREVLTLIAVTRVPQTPDYMLGVINLRGQVVPVVDMRLKLGMATGEESRDSCIVILEIDIDDEVLVVGALADGVREVLDIAGDQIEPAPRLGSKLRSEFIQGMGKVDEQFVILLDINRVFNSDEIALVQDVGSSGATAENQQEVEAT